MHPTAFREARWTRAGASDTDLERLRDAHTAMTVDEQTAEGTRIDSVSDDDLAAELKAAGEDPTAGSVDDILARVAGDPQAAAVVLSHEQVKARPRKGLVDALTALVAGQGD